MIAWREAHPDWPPQAAAPVRLAEWLAVWGAAEERLAARLAARHWGLPPEALAAALSRCPEEFWCRRLLYAGELPEPLADRARYAAGRIHDAPQAAWRTLAAAIYAAIFRPDRPGARLRRAGTWLWPAFRLLLSAGAGAAEGDEGVEDFDDHGGVGALKVDGEPATAAAERGRRRTRRGRRGRNDR
jgi:hypothetical protein